MATILDRWDDLVDARTGIVRELVELRVDDDEPRFVHYLSYACSTEPWGFLPNFGNNGGVGTTRETALAKAIGESVERYCSALFSYDDLVWSAYEDLDRPGTPPGSFALYGAGQYEQPGFPWAPFTPRTPVAWTPGRSLTTGDEVLVPAPFVFVPYHYLADRPDTPITQPISTGLACGSSPDDAALSALCEAIERDAFTITWQARLSRPRIALDSLPPDLTDLVERYASVGLRIHLVDITTDVRCPVVLSLAEGFTQTSPALAVAAAAHPDPVVACRKSLEELAHTRRFASQVMDYLPPVAGDVEAGHPAVTDQRAHLRFYCPQPAKAFAQFAWSAEETVDLAALGSGTGPQGLDDVAAAVAATGEDAVLVDLTTPDVAELGLSVARVVAPGLHPLQMGHSNRALGGQRLYRVPQRLGYPGLAPGDDDNPNPHPFP